MFGPMLTVVLANKVFFSKTQFQHREIRYMPSRATAAIRNEQNATFQSYGRINGIVLTYLCL